MSVLTKEAEKTAYTTPGAAFNTPVVINMLPSYSASRVYFRPSAALEVFYRHKCGGAYVLHLLYFEVSMYSSLLTTLSNQLLRRE